VTGVLRLFFNKLRNAAIAVGLLPGISVVRVRED